MAYGRHQGKYGSRRQHPDGPRIAPITRKTPDDHFNEMLRSQRQARLGDEINQRRLLAAWLRGAELWAGCGSCGKSVGWKGKWEDRPQCPHCQAIPDLDELRALDAEFAQRSRTIPGRPCEKCKKDVGFVVNVGTGATGPVDMSPKTVVYVCFLPAVAGGALGEDVVFRAMTGKALGESGAKLVFPDGREVPASDLRFHVSHYATCPSAAYFSNNGGMRK